MKKPLATFSLERLRKSFSYAFKGLAYVFRYERNMHIHVVATTVVVVAAFLFNISRIEWGLIVLAIGTVLVAETVNTSIEVLVDLVSPEYNEKAGLVKDLAAGAVTLASIMAVTIGLLVFLPKLRLLLGV